MSGSRIARRYAKALFSLGREDGNFEHYGRDLKEFVDFYKQHMDFRRVITNPVFAVEERKRILQAVLEKSGFSDMVKNFLYLLLEKDRIRAIESIIEYYAKLTDDLSNIARAEIITARPLKDEALERIERSLERLTSKKIRSEVREDQNLIGGVVVKIGDMVLDGSIKSQLEGLKESF